MKVKYKKKVKCPNCNGLAENTFKKVPSLYDCKKCKASFIIYKV